jgi:hypothetical protein
LDDTRIFSAAQPVHREGQRGAKGQRLPSELLITLREGQTCLITVPPSAEPQTIEISRKLEKRELKAKLVGPVGMTPEYRKAGLELTKRQRQID